jgi:hypothetical protein
MLLFDKLAFGKLKSFFTLKVSARARRSIRLLLKFNLNPCRRGLVAIAPASRI